ncbi:MAG: sigma-70 family RNA polymerase sigma factor [Sandaracinus sp.]|nr:sigma-70 family RNA polymerase sigma factor [Sandaracinus sp.]
MRLHEVFWSRSTRRPSSARTLDVESVYDAHAAFAWNTLQRLGVPAVEAEDLLQEVFLVVHRRLGDFEPEKGELRAWLWGICVHVVRGWRKRAHRRRERVMEPPERLAESGERPDVVAQATDTAAALDALLEELDEERRVVLVMYEMEGCSCAEIAAELAIPTGTVHSRLHAARRMLKELVARREPGLVPEAER